MSMKWPSFDFLYGQGISNLVRYFRYFKLFRLLAAFHEAFGFMKSNYNMGPSYVYALSENLPSQTVCSEDVYLASLSGFTWKFTKDQITKTIVFNFFY